MVNGGNASTASAAVHDTDNQNQWIVIDTANKVLSIGDTSYGGMSPRSIVDSTGRQLLIPRVRRALTEGIARTESTHHRGRRWCTSVLPLLSPITRTPLAVAACYGISTSEFPPAPTVGTWEARVTAADTAQSLYVSWSPQTYTTHGIPVPRGDNTAKYYSLTEVLDDCIALQDRLTTWAAVEAMISAEDDSQLHLHSYHTAAADLGVQNSPLVQVAARHYRQPHATHSWLRGTTMRLGTAAPPQANSSSSVIRAAFGLLSGPITSIDMRNERITLSSPAVADLGLAISAGQQLSDVCHPDDLNQLRTYLRRTIITAPRTVTCSDVQFRREHALDRWIRVNITGTSMSSTSGAPQVMCQLALTRSPWTFPLAMHVDHSGNPRRAPAMHSQGSRAEAGSHHDHLVAG